MAEDGSRLLIHVLRGVEELLRAGGEGAALLRRRLERGEARGEEVGVAARSLASLLDAMEGPLLVRLRAVLRAELERWSARADADPAAARVRDLFAELLEALGPAEAPPRERSGPAFARSAPPRGTRKHSP